MSWPGSARSWATPCQDWTWPRCPRTSCCRPVAGDRLKIGVLALQGDFHLHRKALERCRAEAVEVRKPSELAGLDGLIMPGGESTTLLKLMDEWGFVPALKDFHASGRPIFGTCAGLRSEEHTSELQSLRHLVCRLLLEKKKEVIDV